MLRDRRANMWLRNAKGDLPLHEAASSGRRELVQWLLDQRPKQVNTPSNDGRTIIHIAAGHDYTDMCKVFTIYVLIKCSSIRCVYKYRIICLSPSFIHKNIHNQKCYCFFIVENKFSDVN